MASKAAEAGNLSVAGGQFYMVFKARNWEERAACVPRTLILMGWACLDVPFLRDMAAIQGLDRFIGDYSIKNNRQVGRKSEENVGELAEVFKRDR
jgi:hypothetical protein